MRITGLIVEYNPFHNGHFYHLQKSKELTQPDLTVALMSGNFVQRGQPAIFDKWSRTKMALSAGVDVVAELPTVFATCSAQEFANGAILMLSTMGVTDFVFGAEHDDIKDLWKIATVFYEEPALYRKVLHEGLSAGLSFVIAREKALNHLYPELTPIVSKSNNILAISYLIALQHHGVNIKPHVIKRMGADYHNLEIESSFASASAIRHHLMKNKSVKLTTALPQSSNNIIETCIKQGLGPVSLNSFSQACLFALRSTPIEDIASLFDIEIGLPERLQNCGYRSTSISEWLSCVTTKRYTLTRFQRLLTHLLLRIDSSLIVAAKKLELAPYIRVLGLRKTKSRQYKQWRDNTQANFVEKTASYFPTDKTAGKLWATDLRATDLYFLACPATNQRQARKDFTTTMIVL